MLEDGEDGKSLISTHHSTWAIGRIVSHCLHSYILQYVMSSLFLIGSSWDHRHLVHKVIFLKGSF